MSRRETLRPMSPEERKSFRREILFEVLLSFFKPIVIGWSSFALIAWLVSALKG